jgi:hypothetical protein
MFRFKKPETPRAALLLFLGNETHEKSGFVSYVSFSLCFDFDPTNYTRRRRWRRSEHDEMMSNVANVTTIPLPSLRATSQCALSKDDVVATDL